MTLAEVFISIAAVIALFLSFYCAIRIRQLEKRVNDCEANFSFIRNMLIEIDSKWIKLDIEKHIKEKFSDDSSEDANET